MRPCFAFTNAQATDDTPAILSIYDEIGFWGVQAKDFVTELRGIKSKVINVEINSPGGDVFAGLAIYNALKSSGKEIVVKVMGVAASAASLIAMAGDKIVMPKNTFLMIHNPWSFAMGNADELRETADTLDKIGASLRATYAARTGMDDAKLDEMLAKDTWMTADEALEMGFATEVVEDVKANAKFDMARAELPEAVRAVFAMAASAAPAPTPAPAPGGDDADDSSKAPAPAPAPTPEPVEAFGDTVVKMAAAAGFEAHAAAWAVKYKTADEVQAAISTAREIKALCSAVKMADGADQFIKQGKTLDEVRTALADKLADADTHVDTTPRNSNQPSNHASARTALKTADIWAKRNAKRKE